MTIYVIAYDEVQKLQKYDYKPLLDELKRCNCHKAQYSLWVGDFSSTAQELHDRLRSFMHEDDRLWVSELVKNHKHTKSFVGTTDWIKKHPPTR